MLDQANIDYVTIDATQEPDLAEKFDAILIGPGIGRDKETSALVKKVVAEIDKPLILDADAIFAFNGNGEELKTCKQIPILTPHLGELAALLNISVEELRGALVENVRNAIAFLSNILYISKHRK